jgi:predicted HicB family RNase H-like nuclease
MVRKVEFRGEFLGLNGGADFYGKSLNQWAAEALLEAAHA